MITTNRNNTWWLRRLPVVKKLKIDFLRLKTFRFHNCQFLLPLRTSRKKDCHYLIHKRWLIVTPWAKRHGHHCTLFGEQNLLVLLPRMTCAAWSETLLAAPQCSSESQVRRTAWRTQKEWILFELPFTKIHREVILWHKAFIGSHNWLNFITWFSSKEKL